MKKMFIIGSILSATLIAFSFLSQNFYIGLKISGLIGAMAIIFAGIATGAFQQRNIPAENYQLEDKKLRDIKTRWSIKIIFFGIPFIISAIISFLMLRF